jgi:hypothetical protein
VTDPEKADALHDAVDAALQAWQQGDCVLGEHWFVFRLDPRRPLTNAAVDAARDESDLAETAVRGLVILSQTCDVARSCRERPFLEVAPLVEVEPNELRNIEQGRRPRYAYLPGLAEHSLVTDLDRVMTIEKAVVLGWTRTAGCQGDAHIRALQRALARKRARIAFPDDFVQLVNTLQRRIVRKHDKGSDEGRALRALSEIRVRAAPSWQAERVDVLFHFIRTEDAHDFEGQRWDIYLGQWLAFVQPCGRFCTVEGEVVTLADLTAKDYVESDPLDLDHLSDPGPVSLLPKGRGGSADRPRR